MGNQPGAYKADQLLQAHLPHFTGSRALNVGGEKQLVQTMLCQTQNEGQVVCKLYNTKKLFGEANGKSEQSGSDQQQQKKLEKLVLDMRHIREVFDLRKHPNVLVLVMGKIEDADKKEGFLVACRQFVYQSLQEKLRNKIPQLQDVEKKWLILQLLCAVSQIHSENITHGDIKPENILLTSYNQVFLTDLVSYKPAYLALDDLQTYKTYFGELENTNRCYIAPERFVDPKDYKEWKEQQDEEEAAGHLQAVPRSKNLPTDFEHKQAMDIFSAGCVIAEILLDRGCLFDLAALKGYKRQEEGQDGEGRNISDTVAKIGDPDIIELVMKMIAPEPGQRPKINDCIQQWNAKVMPMSFSRVFFQLSSSFVRPQYLFSDMKISLLRKFMPSIWRACFDSKAKPLEVQKKFLEPIEKTIFEKLREDNIEDHNEVLIPRQGPAGEDEDGSRYHVEGFDFIKIKDGEESKELAEIGKADKESAIILIHWIGTFINTCFFPQTRRCALEMLLVIAKVSSLETRLQFILPYVFKMFEDKQSKVLAKAIEVAVLMFKDIVDSDLAYTLSTTDYKVFDHYIMPQFTKLQKSHKDDQLVQVTWTRYLPLLAKIGHRFTELSVRSRLAVASNADSRQDSAAQGRSNQRAANFDQDIDSLRKHFVPIIRDSAANEDKSIERLLFSSLGSLCDFLGSKLTMDNLIPLLGTAPSKREFLIRLACLQSVTGVGIKVGKQTLSQYLLVLYTGFLHDSEELVVLEVIKTLGRLLQLGLIPKAAVLDDFQSGGSGAVSDNWLDKLLPFLLHPNTWIREATLNFIKILSDHENTKLLTKAEVFCIIRNKLKPYLQNAVSSLQFMQVKYEPSDLLQCLRKPLSGHVFESVVKGQLEQLDQQPELKLSDTDKYAQSLLHEVIAKTQKQYQQTQLQMRSDLKNTSRKPLAHFWRRADAYNQYRVVKASTLKALDPSRSENAANGQDKSARRRAKRQEAENKNAMTQYQNQFFEPCKQLKAEEVDNKNYGLNPREGDQAAQENGDQDAGESASNQQQSKSKPLSEIDEVMQALRLMPDIEDDDDLGVYTKVANQGLPVNWKLQTERLGILVPQPSELPSHHSHISRTTSVQIESTPAFSSKNKLGEPRRATEKHRPQGRLITTLHEHKNPVHSIAVTQDQQMFLTASREDSEVKVWSTKDIERDVTSHSLFSIQSKRERINQICTLQNQENFVVAGKGGIDIYSMERSSQESKNQSARQPNHRLPNASSIVQSFDHGDEGDILGCLNTMLPVSHQNMLVYCSQRGSLFMHDLRCKTLALQEKNTFAQQRGMITSMSQGQDPYQLFCGTIGGYVMVYDLRFNVVSTAYKHSQKYPINSVAAFRPQQESRRYNRSTATSPMALVAAGGPTYELSLLNLETGNVEILMTVDDRKSSPASNAQGGASNLASSVTLPSFYRESYIRDSFSWPEKSETNQSLFKRYLMQTKSLVSTQQIKLTQNLDDELFKASKDRYRLVKQANESTAACRKVLVPRRFSNLLHGTQTVDYAITGGNDMRLRYWSISDPVGGSYYINTPDNDECQYHSTPTGGGTQCVIEEISGLKNFPAINANLMQSQAATNQKGGRLAIPNTEIEMKGDSIYYSILANMINGAEDAHLSTTQSARNFLSQGSASDAGSGAANQYQIDVGQDKITVYNYNGLSEWQHLNGLCMNRSNATLQKDSYNDRWGPGASASGGKQGGQKGGKRDLGGQARNQGAGGGAKGHGSALGQDYLFIESRNVSHSDTILDMAMLELDQSGQGDAPGIANESGRPAALPLLITSSRDGTVKLWR